MTTVVSLHSFRGGTGKSNVTANTAAAVAHTGQRVAIVDTDINSPGIHVIFQLTEPRIKHTLNDYLWGQCSIQECTYEVTPSEWGGSWTQSSQSPGSPGSIYLVPSSMDPRDISRVLHKGYDARQLKDGFKELIRAFDLDYLFIDTHPGLNEETLLSIAVSHILVIILRPDTQDYQGTSVTLEVARKLGVPNLYLVMNKLLPEFNFTDFRRQLEETYQCPVGAILPLSTEMIRLASAGLFILKAPDHPLSQSIHELASKILTT